MDELKEKAKVIAIKHAKALAAELVVEVIPAALEAVAAKSENKVDDALVAVLKEPLKAAVLELVNKIEA